MNRQNHSPHDLVRARADRMLAITAALWGVTWPRPVAARAQRLPTAAGRGLPPRLNPVARSGMSAP